MVYEGMKTIYINVQINLDLLNVFNPSFYLIKHLFLNRTHHDQELNKVKCIVIIDVGGLKQPCRVGLHWLLKFVLTQGSVFVRVKEVKHCFNLAVRQRFPDKMMIIEILKLYLVLLRAFLRFPELYCQVGLLTTAPGN